MRLGRPVSLYPPVCFPARSLTPLLQRKTIKKQMSKRCTFYVLIIPALCLSICYSLTSAVKKKKKKKRKEEEVERTRKEKKERGKMLCACSSVSVKLSVILTFKTFESLPLVLIAGGRSISGLI